MILDDMVKATKRNHEEEHHSLDMQLASKVLDIPSAAAATIKTKSKLKKPSKQLQQVITKIGATFMTLEDSINEALKLGRAEGFTDMQIGDMIREEFKRLNRPRMTLSRYLPITAKHEPRGNPQGRISNKLLLNKPVAISTESVTLSGRPGYPNEPHPCYKDVEYEVEKELILTKTFKTFQDAGDWIDNSLAPLDGTERDDGTIEVQISLPVVITVDPKERTAKVVVNMDELDEWIKYDTGIKAEEQPKSKTKAKTKRKKHTVDTDDGDDEGSNRELEIAGRLLDIP